MSAVYYLTLRQLTGKWRLIIMAVLATLPVIISVIMLSSSHAPSVANFEIIVLGGMLAGTIAPLVVLATGTVAFANEIEDCTLANLTLAPMPRWQIVLPKLLGVITVAAPFIAVSAWATSYIAFLGDARAVAAVTLGAILGVALYASAFTWLGVVSTHAIAAGLLYIVLWEGFLSGYVSGVRMLSLRHYTMGLMHVLDVRRFSEAHLDVAFAIAASAIVLGGFVLLSVTRLRRMDVP